MPFTAIQMTTVDTTPVTHRVGVEAEVWDTTLTRFRTWIYLESEETVNAFALGELAMQEVADIVHGHVVRSTGAIHPRRILGVAQHVVAVGAGAWFGRKGEFEVLFSAADPAQGAAIVPAALAGTAADAAAPTDAAFGYSLDDANGGGVGTCWINCQG